MSRRRLTSRLAGCGVLVALLALATTSQMRGALLFFGKAKCSTCHTGPALNSMSFHALGMKDLDGSVDSRVDQALRWSD